MSAARLSHTTSPLLNDDNDCSSPSPISVGHSPVLRDILADIDGTRRGVSKHWLNVQSCVLAATQQTVQALLSQGGRLDQQERELRAMRQTVELLLEDRGVKEERYQLDRAEWEDTAAKLTGAVRQVQTLLNEHLLTCSHQCSVSSPPLVTTAETPRLESHPDSIMPQQVATLVSALADLKEQVAQLQHHIQNDGQRGTAAAERQAAHATSPSSPPSVSKPCADAHSWSHYHNGDRSALPMGHDTGCERSPRPVGRSSSVLVHAQMVQEVRRLRDQWESFLEHQRSHQLSPPQATAQLRCTPCATATAFRPLPKARWFWDGDGGSHFSRALRRSAHRGGGSPPIPWTDQRFCDPRTQCWYTVGGCPYEEVNGGDAETYFRWVCPTVIHIARSGVYRYASGLVHTATEGSPKAVALLYVNNRSVQQLVLSSYVAVRSEGESSTALNKHYPGSRHIRTPATAGRPSTSPERAAAVLRPSSNRLCCEPMQLSTNTVSDYVFLTEGSELSLRCHSAHNTKAVYEAFFELEHIA